MVVLLVFAVSSNLWPALAMLLGTPEIAGTIGAPVKAAWLNRNLDSATRATVLSIR